ncbi:MAG: MFS transporter [Bacteroidia bacterium]|nr:MFS transporter [Bacteroidia bacterium]
MEEINTTTSPTEQGQQAPAADTKKAPLFTPYQAFVVAILALMQFTIILDFMILSPLGDILMKTLKITDAQFGTVVSAYALSAGASGLLAAGFADKFDRKKLLLFFYTGFILGTIFCGMANSYATLLIARIVTGIFGGVVGSIGMAIITDVFSINQRGRVMGFVQMGFAASQVLGIPIGLKIASAMGWHWTFFMVVIFGALIGIVTVIKLKPVNEHLKLQSDKNAFMHLWHTIQKRDYRIGFLATAFLSLGGFMIMPFTTAFLVNNVNIAQDDLSTIFFCTGIGSVIIMPLIGKISDSIDKFKLFTIGTILAGVMVIIYTNLTPVPLWIVIMINVVMFMGIMGRMVPSVALNSAVPGMADRGAYMSINSSLQQAAGGIGAIVAGLIVMRPDQSSPLQNFNILGYIMVAVFLLCMYFVYRVSKIVEKKAVKAAN